MADTNSAQQPRLVPPLPAKRTRLTADARRAQLTEIGFLLLQERPLHELALDEIAERAGISRTLLFHYFPTKSDFYAAVVDHASQLLRGIKIGPSSPSAPADIHARATQLISGYIELVAEYREVYLRLVRTAGAGDDNVRASIDELRASLVPTWIEIAQPLAAQADQQLLELLMRGWLVHLEEVALLATQAGTDTPELSQALSDIFVHTVSAAIQEKVAETQASPPA